MAKGREHYLYMFNIEEMQAHDARILKEQRERIKKMILGKLGKTKYKTPSKMFVVYDGRAIDGYTSDALVLLATHQKREAIQWANEYSGVVFSYDVKPEDNSLINEKQIYIFTEKESEV